MFVVELTKNIVVAFYLPFSRAISSALFVRAPATVQQSRLMRMLQRHEISKTKKLHSAPGHLETDTLGSIVMPTLQHWKQ